MSTAVAQPVQTIKVFPALINRQHVKVPTNREVSSRTGRSAIPVGRGLEGRQRPSFLAVLLRSMTAFAV
jgi:hypothetical protein